MGVGERWLQFQGEGETMRIEYRSSGASEISTSHLIFIPESDEEQELLIHLAMVFSKVK